MYCDGYVLIGRHCGQDTGTIGENGMNCKDCLYYGDCKAWREEKEYFDKYNIRKLPPEGLHRIFEVTKHGVQCHYFLDVKDMGERK